MPRPRKLLCLVLTGLLLASCSGERDAPREPANPLQPAVKPTCDTEAVADIIEEMFPEPGLENEALTKCANIEEKVDSDQIEVATSMIFAFLDQVFELAADDQIEPLSGKSLEESITELFAALFGLVGVDPDDVAIGIVDETGGTVTALSLEGGVHFDAGQLLGDTFVWVVGLADPEETGDCPFSFDPGFDCYPKFFDFGIDPESNLVGNGIVALCVVDPPDPFAPPASIAGDLRIASEDDDNPGTLTFWPLADGTPTGVECEEPVEIFGTGSPWSSLWAGLGPLEWIFHPTPAYANPARLGASVSAFSPFAATDPAPAVSGSISGHVFTSSEPPEPIANQEVTLSSSDVEVDRSTTTDPQGRYSFEDLPIPGGLDTQYTVSTFDPTRKTFDSETVTLDSEDPEATDVDLFLSPIFIDE